MLFLNHIPIMATRKWSQWSRAQRNDVKFEIYVVGERSVQ